LQRRKATATAPRKAAKKREERKEQQSFSFFKFFFADFALLRVFA
jgi:hypothetical protein